MGRPHHGRRHHREPRTRKQTDATMPMMNDTTTLLRRLAAAITLAIAAATMLPANAHAQLVAVMVNGDPITNYDIEQRTKLIVLSTHKQPTRQEVIKDLIEEHLKLQLIKRYSIE